MLVFAPKDFIGCSIRPLVKCAGAGTSPSIGVTLSAVSVLYLFAMFVIPERLGMLLGEIKVVSAPNFCP